MRFIVDITPASAYGGPVVEPLVIADALFEFLVNAGEIEFPDEVVASINGVEHLRDPERA